MRCLECAKPTCTDNCPVGVKVKDFVQLIVTAIIWARRRKFAKTTFFRRSPGASVRRKITAKAVACYARKVKPLGIGYLERFVADYEQRISIPRPLPNVPPTGKKLPSSGAAFRAYRRGRSDSEGPRGHVFEALHELGGVLVYGIPEFRLPKQIIREQLDYMRAMGVDFETDVVVGRTVTIDELLEEEGFDAVFIGTGAGSPQFMGIPGEHLNGVYSANEFLTRINLMHAYEFPTYDEPMLDFRGKKWP